jgi:hypothetical protein
VIYRFPARMILYLWKQSPVRGVSIDTVFRSLTVAYALFWGISCARQLSNSSKWNIG